MMRRAFLSTLPRLATRRQAFKEHVWSLRQQDPGRWTTHVLAHHFKVPVENMHAMLVLKELEVEAGSIDEELTSLAEDAEEYLDSEYALDLAPSDSTEGARRKPGASETFYDREQQQQQQGEAASAASDGDLSLERMSYEEERALISAVASRFGGNDDPPFGGATPVLGSALRAALSSLSLEEMAALHEQVAGKAAAADASEEGLRGALLASLTASGTPPVDAALLAPDGNGGPAAVAIEDLPLPQVSIPRRGAAAPSGGGAAFWYDGTQSAPKMRAVRSSGSRRTDAALAVPARVVDGEVRRPRRAPTAGSALSLEEMRAVGVPDFGARLRQNVERRARLLAPDAEHYPYRNRGRYLFADITRGGRRESTPQAKRAWVSQRGAPGEGGTTREPTESELRHARLRAQPPIMTPRIKRNQ